MAIFNFPMHSRSVEYPQTGINVQMGGGHLFSMASAGAQQRVLVLTFEALQFFFTNGKVDASIMPPINLYRLELFYQEHLLHKNFVYPDEVYGELVVRFAKPFKIPKGEAGGMGVYKGIELTLIEVPKPDAIDSLTNVQFISFDGVIS